MDIEALVREKAQAAKEASRLLAVMKPEDKNRALYAMADMLEKRMRLILDANAEDLEEARTRKDVKRSCLDRLMLDESRIHAMAQGLRETAALADPIGRGDFSTVRPNGLEIRRVRVPLGVVGIIYEARPNVTADAAGLCLKSGNAVLLRGGSEAIRSNSAIASLLVQAAQEAGVPQGALGFIDSTDRKAVESMMHLDGLLDVVIPRGGAGLIRAVVRQSTVPVIETGCGVCHTFVDESADFAMAEKIVLNAKVSRPSVCNAMETLLVHEGIAGDFLPRIVPSMEAAGVEVRGCEKARAVCTLIKEATEEDWSTEYGRAHPFCQGRARSGGSHRAHQSLQYGTLGDDRHERRQTCASLPGGGRRGGSLRQCLDALHGWRRVRLWRRDRHQHAEASCEGPHGTS